MPAASGLAHAPCTTVVMGDFVGRGRSHWAGPVVDDWTLFKDRGGINYGGEEAFRAPYNRET